MIPSVQKWAVNTAAESLEEQTGLQTTVAAVSFRPLRSLRLDSVTSIYPSGDTAFSLDYANLALRGFQPLKQQIKLGRVRINKPKVHLYACSSAGKKKPKKDGEATPWFIDWKGIIVDDIEFQLNDTCSGLRLAVHCNRLVVDPQRVDLGQKDIHIKEVNALKPDVRLSLPTVKSKKDSSKAFSLAFPFAMQLDYLQLTDGSFQLLSLDSNTLIPERIENLDFIASRIAMQEDTLTTQIDYAAFDTENGFSLDLLTGNVLLHNNGAALTDFQLNTGHSRLSRNVAFAFPSDRSSADWIQNISINAEFNPSRLALADLHYFMPIPKYKDLSLVIQGDVFGDVQHLQGQDLSILTQNGSLLKGELSLRNLNDVSNTFIFADLQALKTNAKQVEPWLAGMTLPSTLHQLGDLFFQGQFIGFPSDFVAYGKGVTDIGTFSTDINVKLPSAENATASYTGQLQLERFHVGELFSVPQEFGITSMAVSLEGEGLDLQTLDAQLEGRIDSFEFRGYALHDFTLNGTVRNRFFNGQFEANDRYLKARFDGSINLQEEVPTFAFQSTVDHVDLYNLSLTSFPLAVAAKVQADFSASNIENINGQIDLTDIVTQQAGKSIDWGTLRIQSTSQPHYKALTANGSLLEAQLNGRFTYKDLPALFRYVVLNQVEYGMQAQAQYVQADIRLFDSQNRLAALVPGLLLDSSLTLSAYLGQSEKRGTIRLQLPDIGYKKYALNDLDGYLTRSGDSLYGSWYNQRLTLSDSTLVKDLRVSVNGPLDQLFYRLELEGPTPDFQIELAALQTPWNSMQSVVLEPTTWLINNKYWTINESNRLLIDGNKIYSHNVGLSHFDESIDIVFNHLKGKQNIQLLVGDIDLEDILRIPTKQRDAIIFGELNGDVVLSDIYNQPTIYGYVNGRDLRMNKHEIGDLELRADLVPNTNRVAVSGALKGKENDVALNGYYAFGKPAKPNDLNIDIDVTSFAVSTIEDAIPDYITNSKGTVRGALRVTGYRHSPNLLGALRIGDVQTTVSYLNTTYHVADEEVKFDERGIDLGRVRVEDDDGNEAFGTGRINHNHLKDFALDISVESDKVMGLNTTKELNADFFGKAYLDGGVRFTGPTNNLLIEVFGNSEAVSQLNIPLNNTADSKTYSFYTFVTPKEEEKDTKEEGVKLMDTRVNLKLELNQNAEINLILDEEAGDILKTRGEGDVEIDVNTADGNLNLFGVYTITDGDYLFTLQRIINKRFRIQPGSEIRFNGPISDAAINVRAIYNLRTTTFNLIQDYLSDLGGDNPTNIASRAQNRIPVQLILDLTGPLEQPEVGFQIALDINDPQLRNAVESKMAIINQNENELNRQVFGLLVLNQFIPTNSPTQAGINTIQTGATNTVSEFLSTQLSGYFNDWLSTFVEDIDFNINYRSYDQLNTYGEFDLQRRRELQLALSKRFLDDRLSVTVGGNIDFGQDYYNAEETNTNFAGDANVQYALTKDRRLRFKAFTATDYDIFQQSYITRAGLGLSYQREYNNLKEVFQKRRQKREQAAADTTSSP